MSWKLASFGSLLVAVALAGCSTTEPSRDAVTDLEHTRCEAKAAEFAIGKKASSELLQQAKTRTGAQDARILGPHDIVTLEYRSDRLNLNADENGVITRANCG